MSGEGGDNIIGVRTVYDAVLRLEGKFDAHKQSVEAEVDVLRADQTYLKGKIDGWMGMVKWLGPTGVAALILGLLTMLSNGSLHLTVR
jgi:hypothetical protein